MSGMIQTYFNDIQQKYNKRLIDPKQEALRTHVRAYEPKGHIIKTSPFSLSNALQNAYDASINVKDSYVEITSVERDNVYIISLKNRTDKKVVFNEDGLPISIKTGDGHGYGIRNIREIARKHNGDIEIKQLSEKDGLWFVLNIMLVS